MTAALAFLRAGLRNGWRGWLGLALIVGLFGGAVESAAAGARRTDSAYPLLVTWSKAPDVLIYSLPGQPTFARLAPASVERLPQVTGSAMLATFTVLNPAVITLIAPASTEVPAASGTASSFPAACRIPAGRTRWTSRSRWPRRSTGQSVTRSASRC